MTDHEINQVRLEGHIDTMEAGIRGDIRALSAKLDTLMASGVDTDKRLDALEQDLVRLKMIGYVAGTLLFAGGGIGATVLKLLPVP